MGGIRVELGWIRIENVDPQFQNALAGDDMKYAEKYVHSRWIGKKDSL